MKAEILDLSGKKIKQIEARIFDNKIREDIAQKVFEVEKRIQPYAPFEEAGKQHSASGKVRHQRHKWRSAYGRGISRVPRKIFWRRGTQFYWVGAEISSVRGGRRAHPPKIARFQKKLKINKKEIIKAFQGAFAATAKKEYLQRRYEKLKEKDVKVPIIVESKILKLKTKEFFSALKKMLNDNFELALKNKKIRAGKGKARNRKYKSNAGILFVIGNDENFKIKGVEVMKTNELEMKQLFPLGRLTIYTEKAVEELNKLGEGERKAKEEMK